MEWINSKALPMEKITAESMLMAMACKALKFEKSMVSGPSVIAEVCGPV